jgi:hypothetical protein
VLNKHYIRGALARVCNSDGATLGTAFFVLAKQGIALTCHHLVENRNTVSLHCADGEMRKGFIADADRFPEIDLALISCEGGPADCALPIVDEYEGITHFWTNGFHYYGISITDALPTQGVVDGPTSIVLTTGTATYSLHNVLILNGLIIDPGLSGAPVVDPATGVVFAIVNAKFMQPNSSMGFAFPLKHVKEHSPRLKELFESNSNTVARYGRFMNYLGAREICNQQREVALDRLIRWDFYLRDFHIKRAEQEVLNRFYESSARILTVIGTAGVGKTNLLANFAQEARDKPMLLLLGRDLTPNHSNLSLAAAAALHADVAELFGPDGDVSLLATTVGKNKRRLIILLDGLNEIPVTMSASFPAFIDHTFDWLERTDTKLILSSRPEFWQTWEDRFPMKLMTHNDAPRLGEGIVLNDFNEEEARQARERYELPSSISSADIKHPLMTRIYWEIKSKANVGQVSRYRAMQRFIKKKCDRIVQNSGSNFLSSQVEVFLSNAAQRALAKGGFELDDQEFFDLFAGNMVLATQSVHEGMFITGSGVTRFAFDEVAEFLQSRSLDVDTISKRFSAGPLERPNVTSGALVYYILRLEDEGKTEDFMNAMQAVIAGHNQFGENAVLTESVLAQVLPQISHAEQFLPGIRIIVDRIVDRPFLSDIFNLRSAIAHSGLSSSAKLELLKPFLMKEDSFEFEHNHWSTSEDYVTRDDGHTGTSISQVIRDDPRSALVAIAQWLSDSTKLLDAGVTIADAAAAIMFYNRDVAFEFLCEVLVRSLATKPELTNPENIVLYRLIELQPNRVLEVCLQWAESKDSVLITEAGRLGTQLAVHLNDEASQHHLYKVFVSAMSLGNPQTEIMSKVGIGRLLLYRHLVVEELIGFFKRRTPNVGSYDIAALSNTHFELVISAIRDLIKSNAKLACEALFWVCSQHRDDQEKRELMELFKLGADKGLTALYDFQLALENLVKQTETAADLENFLEFVNFIAARDIRGLLMLKYLASLPYSSNNYKNILQDKILELLTNSDLEPGDSISLIRLLAKQYSENRDVLTYMIRLGQKIPAERFHQVLVHAAMQYAHFAKVLAESLQSGVLVPEAVTKAFLNKVLNGEEPSAAASEAVWQTLE